MRYMVESELYQFPAWSGAKSRLDDLVKHPAAYDMVAGYLDMCQMEGDACEPWTETDVNDWLWFELDNYLYEEGFKNEDDEWIDEDDD